MLHLATLTVGSIFVVYRCGTVGNLFGWDDWHTHAATIDVHDTDFFWNYHTQTVFQSMGRIYES